MKGKERLYLAGSEGGGGELQTREGRWPLEGGNGPQMIPSKERGTSVLQIQATEFCH